MRQVAGRRPDTNADPVRMAAAAVTLHLHRPHQSTIRLGQMAISTTQHLLAFAGLDATGHQVLGMRET